MKKPVAKATGFFYARRPGKHVENAPWRTAVGLTSGMRVETTVRFAEQGARL